MAKKNLPSNKIFFSEFILILKTKYIEIAETFPWLDNLHVICVVSGSVYLYSLTYHERLRSGPTQPQVILRLSSRCAQTPPAPSGKTRTEITWKLEEPDDGDVITRLE